MSGEHTRVSTRYFYNSDGSIVFDGTIIHNGSIVSDAGLLSDPPNDQFSNGAGDVAQGNGQAPAFVFDALDGVSAQAAGLSADVMPAFDFMFGNADAPSAGWASGAVEPAFDRVNLSLLSNENYDGGVISGDTKFSFDLPHGQFPSASLDGAQEIGAPFFMSGVFGGANAPATGLTAFAVPAFDNGNVLPDAASGGGGGITLFGTDSFAKSGSTSTGGGTSSVSSGVLTQYFSGSWNGTAGYDIWIDFKGSGWTVDLQKAFINAADYFTGLNAPGVITNDIGGGGLYRGKVIDDLYVSAELKAIDGVGGILGQAGPTAVWSATELTAAGQMQFDSADAVNYLGKGLWDDIVTHEMMHVLGFGSLWNYGANPLVSNYQYLGAAGLTAYQATLGNSAATFIPVESDGGSGTAGSHWDDYTFGNELMTGYINDDGISTNTTDNYLSKFSVMSLADLGYKVTYQDYQYDGVLI
jgi:hypothetical protein